MFTTKSARLVVSRSNRELLQRCISKTASTPNSDAITGTRQQQNPNLASEPETARWARINKYNNNRALSTIQTKAAVPDKTKIAFASKDDVREFMAIFPDIVRDLTEIGKSRADIPEEFTKWYTKVLQYNVPTGKKIRALSTIMAYKMLADPKDLTPENLKRLNVLGWCNELFQSYFLVIDDIMDSSEYRRGVPCWYRVPGVGLEAINDGILIHMSLFSLLHKYFSTHPSYLQIIELYNEVTLKTAIGQSLDCMSLQDGRPKLDQFTMKRYDSIVKYKTAYYTFQLPTAVAMYFAGITDPELHRQAKTILLEMGHFYQVQDDFLDCFGDPNVTGKKGADIREGKCTWLVVLALQRASPAQRDLLTEHYGRPEAESIQLVKNLYEELSIPNTFAIYEEESFNLIKTHIQQLSKGMPHALFFKFLEKLYKRDA